MKRKKNQASARIKHAQDKVESDQQHRFRATMPSRNLPPLCDSYDRLYLKRSISISTDALYYVSSIVNDTMQGVTTQLNEGQDYNLQAPTQVCDNNDLQHGTINRKDKT